MKKYRITLTEAQLRLMAECVEDCHRFMAGQLELCNTTSRLDNYEELAHELAALQPLVTPELSLGSSWKWSGGLSQNDLQRKFIAETYYLYREIYHRLTTERAKEVNMSGNVYLGETLRCEDSGEPIKIEVIN